MNDHIIESNHDPVEWAWCTKFCKENKLNPFDKKNWEMAKAQFKGLDQTKAVNLIKIDHIEPIGLIAEDGATLATAFYNHYITQAANSIEDHPREAVAFLLATAGMSISSAFQQGIPVDQLDSVLGQIRTYVLSAVSSEK